ncbi:MAG: polyphosphate kinase 1 [Candidatus Omnitrophica bacterium]|nr:polyphosphate kinase 1 [Candidatus Omnitrophota bacterium]
MEPFLSRESSWIEFNRRVFAEATDESNLLLERLKFLGIVSSNFDEFFMVRIASLVMENSPLAEKIYEAAFSLMHEQNKHFLERLVPQMESAGITRVRPPSLLPQHLEYVKNLFQKEIFPILTPIAIHENKEIPALGNLSLYTLLHLQEIQDPEKTHYAVVEMPKNFPRLIFLPSEKEVKFILLEDLISLFSKDLFEGFNIIDIGWIRLTRAAEMTLDEEKDEDFAKVMAEALRERRKNTVVRLEAVISEPLLIYIQRKLGVGNRETFRTQSWLDLKSIAQLSFQSLLLFEELKRPAWIPRSKPEFEMADDLWLLLKEKDIYLFHPYDSFEPVNHFLAEAALDPDVLAIKQTLYRAGADSRLIQSLETATGAGKQVTVLVELKARFDEEKNIKWAQRLEDAGASVLYGAAGFKTHAKACLVVRREPEGIKRYVHLSTGNYNEKTALLYSDVGLFSSDEKLTADISAFFNMVTGFSRPSFWNKIDVAPFGLRRRLERLILREIMRSSKQHPGLIMGKINSLVDPEIIKALYEASKAGVQIKLNVRGVCCLRPGVPGLSENIEVISVVDMFLEHGRLFYFENGGDSELYLSSADWMPRNFDRRIELMLPLEDKEIRKELIEILKCYFKDNVKGWRLNPDGTYVKNATGSEKKFRAQEFFCKKTLERDELLKKIPPKEIRPQKPKVMIQSPPELISETKK